MTKDKPWCLVMRLLREGGHRAWERSVPMRYREARRVLLSFEARGVPRRDLRLAEIDATGRRISEEERRDG